MAEWEGMSWEDAVSQAIREIHDAVHVLHMFDKYCSGWVRTQDPDDEDTFTYSKTWDTNVGVDVKATVSVDGLNVINCGYPHIRIDTQTRR